MVAGMRVSRNPPDPFLRTRPSAIATWLAIGIDPQSCDYDASLSCLEGRPKGDSGVQPNRANAIKCVAWMTP
jgi:hypothetical protein